MPPQFHSPFSQIVVTAIIIHSNCHEILLQAGLKTRLSGTHFPKTGLKTRLYGTHFPKAGLKTRLYETHQNVEADLQVRLTTTSATAISAIAA